MNFPTGFYMAGVMLSQVWKPLTWFTDFSQRELVFVLLLN